jgi:hypothetical protein
MQCSGSIYARFPWHAVAISNITSYINQYSNGRPASISGAVEQALQFLLLGLHCGFGSHSQQFGGGAGGKNAK